MIERIDKSKKYELEDVFDYKKHIINKNEINQDLDDYLTGKIPHGFKSTISVIDNHFLCKRNEFYIVTGKKGQGKTTIYQILQLIFTISNNLIWVVAFQENSSWSMKLNLMNYILGDFANNVKKTNPELFKKAEQWLDKHFIFIKVDDIKTATEVAKGLINDGVDVHGMLLDPINSFKNGWQDTGNGYADGMAAGLELLKFSKEVCSVHITQHPNMSAQRQEGAVNSYQAEGGWFLNKAHNTCAIHRESGSNLNQIRVEHVRNKHTGGNQTTTENPIILEWSPKKINVFMMETPQFKENDIIGYLVDKYEILGKREKKELKEREELPTPTLNEAFPKQVDF